MKYICALQAVCATASVFGDAALAIHVEKADFMKTILSQGRHKLALLIQPAITRRGAKLLQSYKASLEGACADTREDPKVTPLAAESQEYSGPLRRRRKKNQKSLPGSLNSADKTPKANFGKPWFSEWNQSGQYVGGSPRLSPIEVLIQLAHCLNHAAALSVSPSDRYVDLNASSKRQSWLDLEVHSNAHAAKRFDVNGDYQLSGNKVGVPDNPEIWNIRSKRSYDEQGKKSAIGMCLDVTNNQGFAILVPRYTSAGHVKKASALARDLEKKCKKYPNAFLSSLFIPG